MFNEVIIIGKLVNKPVLKSTHNGVKMATVVIQVERPYRNNLGIRENDFINCVLWRGIAETVIDCCDVGSYIGVRGRIQSKTYENDQNKSVSTLEIKVEHVEFVGKYMVDNTF
jgi:single-strand DNA-binding protein